MAGNRKTNRYNGGKANENKMARSLDALSEFEDFTSSILPKIHALLKEGKSAHEIIQWGQALLAARNLSIALTSPDEKTALVASKDLLDRGSGKAAEKIELTTRYEALADDVLDRMLEQQEAQIGMAADDDTTTEKH